MESINSKLRIVFIGSVSEGKECLKEILDLGEKVVGIITFTDSIAQKTSGAVSFEDISKEYDIPIYKVTSTNNPESIAIVKKLQPDIIFVIGWTRLVSKEILEIPRFGCVGMHASLLPKFRGRAPVNWAIIKNEQESGNTTMLLDEGADTGKMIAQKGFSITLADTCQSVYFKVAEAGKIMLREIIPILRKEGELPQKNQNGDQVSVMPRRRPEDGIIDWKKNALELFNWVRALTHPYPGAFTFYNKRKLFLWEARIAHFPFLACRNYEESISNEAGTILSTSDGIMILTGNRELLSIHRLNFEDEPEMPWKDFLSSHSLKVGAVLGQ
jgi:methionyl-tRNA formyltransferase